MHTYILLNLTYNIGAWGNREANRLDPFHQKQLRFLNGLVTWQIHSAFNLRCCNWLIKMR